jgi:hypothetical protein
MDLHPLIRQPRLALTIAVTGALSFWLPDVAIHRVAGPNFNSLHVWVITLVSPTTFLIAYVLARRFVAKLGYDRTGVAMLLGVWFLGGLFMVLSGTIAGNVVGMVVLSFIPIVTYVLATYDGSLFALLAVTTGALLIWSVRSRKSSYSLLRRET